MTVLNLSGKSTQNPTAIISENNQTIDVAVTINDPVFFDNVSSTWKKADSTTIIPQGVFEGSGVVILRGLLTTTGLTPGSFYFLNNTGGLSTTTGIVFIGYAKSATELLVDIDVDPANIMNAITIVTGVGFWVSGETANQTFITSIDKIIFSTESLSTITAQILLPPAGSSTNISSGASSKLNRAGYIVKTNTTSVNKLTYDIETVTILTSFLLGANTVGTTGFVTADINNSGYLENQNDTVGGALTKVDFTTELVSLLTAVSSRSADAILSEPFNSTTNGYWSGGSLSGFSSTFTTIGSVLYSNETSVAISSNLSGQIRGLPQGADDSLGNNTAGFVVLGKLANVDRSNIINKFTFSNDLVTNLGGALIIDRNSTSAVKNNTDAFWNSGGFDTTNMTKFSFTTETGSIPAGLISPTVQFGAGTVND